MAVTIYDGAKKAGVSIATVSKALNDSYTIPDQTKAAIREIADRLGYRPNARAKNFARQASGTVLFITDFYQNIAFENPHMFEIISGIATYLDGKDYSLTLKPLTKQAAPLYIRDIIQQRQADALIIHAFVLSPELAAILSRVDFPYLVIGDVYKRQIWSSESRDSGAASAGSTSITSRRGRLPRIICWTRATGEWPLSRGRKTTPCPRAACEESIRSCRRRN